MTFSSSYPDPEALATEIDMNTHVCPISRLIDGKEINRRDDNFFGSFWLAY
jgi:hypothetical protein